MDVAGAFNNVHHKRLLHNLRTRPIPPCIIKWIQHFLSNRSTRLQFNVAKSEPINTPAGIPQGSPLSPLLYMYYYADLLSVTNNRKGTMSLGYIDDIVYGIEGITDRGNVYRIRKLLMKAEEWRRKHGAQCEVSKYILVHYTRNGRKSMNAAVSVNGITIQPSTEAKYLVIIFDQQLQYKAHSTSVEYLCNFVALWLSGVMDLGYCGFILYCSYLYKGVLSPSIQ